MAGRNTCPNAGQTGTSDSHAKVIHLPAGGSVSKTSREGFWLGMMAWRWAVFCLLLLFGTGVNPAHPSWKSSFPDPCGQL